MTAEELKKAIEVDQRSAMYQGLLSAGLNTLGQAPTPYRQSPMQGIAKGMLSGLGDYNTLLQQSGDRRAKQAQIEIMMEEETRKKAEQDQMAEMLKELQGVPTTRQNYDTMNLDTRQSQIPDWEKMLAADPRLKFDASKIPTKTEAVPAYEQLINKALVASKYPAGLDYATKYGALGEKLKPGRMIDVPGYGPVSEQYAHQYLPKDEGKDYKEYMYQDAKGGYRKGLFDGITMVKDLGKATEKDIKYKPDNIDEDAELKTRLRIKQLVYGGMGAKYDPISQSWAYPPNFDYTKAQRAETSYLKKARLEPITGELPFKGDESKHIPLKPLDEATAAAILKEAGGDKYKDKARQIAKERGYQF